MKKRLKEESMDVRTTAERDSLGIGGALLPAEAPTEGGRRGELVLEVKGEEREMVEVGEAAGMASA